MRVWWDLLECYEAGLDDSREQLDMQVITKA